MSHIPNDCMICNSTFLTTMPIKEVSSLVWDETVASKWFYIDPPHISKELKEFFRQSRVGSNEFPFNLKMCAHFPSVPFTGLYKHS